MMNEKENILVSACLLGAHCRYDGECQNILEFEEKLSELMQRYHLVPFCPEIYGGLQTPRNPAEIRDGKVYDNQGTNVTDQFLRGAEEALAMAQRFHCEKAVLKMRSPSCGSGHIYDGTFSKVLIEGDGMTAGLLKQHGIDVYGEADIEKLLK
ncbi:MAG: DUF523 domain-containing protein [Lachnospira sp.]|nr:DUF523 domain-containing protein [Lachnospira sp.]